MHVPHDLNFDVTGLLDEAFDEDARVPEARLRFPCGALEAGTGFLVVRGDPHPLAAATRGGLEHHRIADVTRNAHRLVRIGRRFVMTGNGAKTRRYREAPGGELVAHAAYRFGRRTHEADPLRREPASAKPAFSERKP